MEDDLVCEYDSTWDTESDGDELGENPARRCSQDRNKRARAAFWSNSSSRNLQAAKDMQNYRHGYPNIIDDDGPEERMPNLKFYLNEIKSSPDDVSIETFHSEWRTDYKRLERVHSYIQWLFPLREPGVNYMATELTKKEIQAFRESAEAKRRLVDSYELMLGFYGIQLLSRETGEVKRSENWRERFANLERNMHNNLRITRILKSLGELGFEHYQAPLVRFFLEETLVRKNLSSMKRSVLDYFLFAVRDKRERRKLIRYAFQHFEPKDKFVWCPRKIQKRFKKKAEKRQDPSLGNGLATTSEEPNPSRTQGKNRDGDREVKIFEIQKQSDDDPLSVVFEKQLESSTTDVETFNEGSSVDHHHSPLNNGSRGLDGGVEGGMDGGLDCGEMDHSNSAEPDAAKIQDANTDEPMKDSSPAMAAKARELKNESILHESDHDGTNTKTVENVVVETKNCSPELSSSQEESENEMLTADPQPREIEGSPATVTCSGKAQAESPKHTLPSPPLGGRAEKLPRTNADCALGSSDLTEVSPGDAMSVSLLDNQGNSDSNNLNSVKKQTNGTEKVEPMDTDPSVGSRSDS
ncbi:opioid growth factor receptor-like protein 1 [Astyanax mexicanus]|uniref:Opioid growth factor receptor-like protein 1 n=1 Tax=Astyanax mexicanus TaxID=7994 RepID=A0A8T2LIX4_ASTMX|nr:opioid growth factor receptor-like protein 1 [Astyanax mexicanus]